MRNFVRNSNKTINNEKKVENRKKCRQLVTSIH